MVADCRIKFRAVTNADLETVLRWRNDPDVSEFLAEESISQREVQDWYEQAITNPNVRLYAIETENGRFIGYGGLQDIDWGERTVRVERAWNLGRVKVTKTYEERTVDLTPELIQALARHMTWLKAEALRQGWGKPEWLFPNEEGKPHDEARVRKVFKRRSGRRSSPASVCTTSATPSRHCSWPRVRPSPT